MLDTTDTVDADNYSGLPRGRWIDVDGVRTWFTETGTGPVAVLVHGGHAGSPYCSQSVEWSGIFAHATDRQRLIALDRIGQGFTDNPARIEDYSLHLSVAHVASFIEKLGVGAVHLIGHSRGGYVAARVALERQDLIHSLSLINSSSLAPGVGTNEPTMGRSPGETTFERVKWMYSQYHFDSRNARDAEVEATRQASTSEKYRELLRVFAEESLLVTHVFPDLARGKRETLAWLREGRLQRPTQVIWGRNDRTALPERGMELYEILRKHERRTTMNYVERSGHFPHLEQPAWVSQMLGGFIQDVENHVL